MFAVSFFWFIFSLTALPLKFSGTPQGRHTTLKTTGLGGAELMLLCRPTQHEFGSLIFLQASQHTGQASSFLSWPPFLYSPPVHNAAHSASPHVLVDVITFNIVRKVNEGPGTSSDLKETTGPHDHVHSSKQTLHLWRNVYFDTYCAEERKKKAWKIRV